MATAKKAAPKAAATPKVKTPDKVAKPAVKPTPKKAPVSKTAKAIAKLGASIAKLVNASWKGFPGCQESASLRSAGVRIFQRPSKRPPSSNWPILTRKSRKVG